MKTHNPTGSDRILRLPDVEQVVGLKRERIRQLEVGGQFPRRFKILGGNGIANGWSEREIGDWVKRRIEEAPRVELGGAHAPKPGASRSKAAA
jgi:predicted DNA-binding transcriptional regulator AlpA